VPISELFMPGLQNRENANGLSVIGRLRGREQAPEAQMAVTRFGAELERRYPRANRGMGGQAAVFPLREQIVRRAPSDVLLLPVIVLALFGIVLLIACGNVAGLLLARAAARRHEIAVRMALGARRARLVQALAAEALVLDAISAAGGVLLTSSASNRGTAIRCPTRTIAIFATALRALSRWPATWCGEDSRFAGRKPATGLRPS
jgi:hypothetical protein